MRVAVTKGRKGPRTFDRAEALDTAMRLFWRQGYEGTSLADLTRAIGIAPPSLYAAFGNKAALYREALDRYASMPDKQLDVGEAATLAEAIRNLLRRAAERVTDPEGQTGCMISFGLVEHGSGAADVAVSALEQRRSMKRRIADLLSSWLDGEAATRQAALLMTVLTGMAVAARDGAARDDLYAIVDELGSIYQESVRCVVPLGAEGEC